MKTFKAYLEEDMVAKTVDQVLNEGIRRTFIREAVTAQQGFTYEKNAANVLKKFNVVPKGFTHAGAGSDIPDLMLQKNNVEAGCELKIHFPNLNLVKLLK